MSDLKSDSESILDMLEKSSGSIKKGLAAPELPKKPPEEEATDIDDIDVGGENESDLSIFDVLNQPAGGGEKAPEKPDEEGLDLGGIPEVGPEDKEEPVKPEEAGAGPLDVQDAPEKPKKRVWEPVDPTDNNAKNLTFRSNMEGVMLDMQCISDGNKLWIARMYKNNKLLDYGQVVIPNNIDNPIEYIMQLANAMLDYKTMRYEKQWQQYYRSKGKDEEGVGEEQKML